jgi:hypothetical protein
MLVQLETIKEQKKEIKKLKKIEKVYNKIVKEADKSLFESFSEI